MLIAANSHIGLIRQSNQDVFEISKSEDPVQFLIIADGMGGASAGDVASRIAVDAVKDQLLSAVSDSKSELDWVDILRGAVLRANEEIWNSAQSHEEYFGMGTTVVVAICEAHQVIFAHVGDSRGYLMHINYLKQVTKDHSLVAELVRRGQLTPDEASRHPQRNIVTRSLGAAKEMVVDIDILPWQPGDAVLLCTDGLSNLVSERELLDHMLVLGEAMTNEDVHRTVEKLLDLGLERGAPDNITLAIAVNQEGKDEG